MCDARVTLSSVLTTSAQSALSENSACYASANKSMYWILCFLLTRNHSHCSRVEPSGQALFGCAEAGQTAVPGNHRRLGSVAVPWCALAVVALDCHGSVATNGHSPQVMSSAQAAVHYCCKCGFGCPGMHSGSHSRARTEHSPVARCRIHVAGIHTAAVYQGPVAETGMVDETQCSLNTESALVTVT